MTEAIQEAAITLRDAYSMNLECDPIRTLLPPGDLAAAYAVQRLNLEQYISDGRRVVGHKIGLSAKSVKQQLGLNQPTFGTLFADTVLADGQAIAFGKILQPKAGVEVALVLERDLPAVDTTISDLIQATAFVLPAIEINGCRIRGWDVDIVDAIADNGTAGLVALGTQPKKIDECDLALCGMALFENEEPVSVGAGAACMGSPLVAATWLARKMVEVGLPLSAGDIILTGALGPLTSVKPGQRYEAKLGGIGSVSVFCEKDPNDG